MQATTILPRAKWPASEGDGGRREVAEETPVAIVHDGATTAVMMATPTDLQDFAVGFSLTEGVVEDAAAIRRVEEVASADGVELRIWLETGAGARLARRRRLLAGPTGCGLCGVESLAEAARPARRVVGATRITADELLDAMAAMDKEQELGRATRAAHAAGFWRDGRLIAVREDVGRHNALDKLVGALARSGQPANGVVLLTSRVSVEMAQKAAMIGAPVIAAVSAPTALAIRTADAAGLTLIAVARPDSFEIFTHPERITPA